MMALVGIERRLGRLPARVPDGIAVLYVVVASVLIERRIVCLLYTSDAADEL